MTSDEREKLKMDLLEAKENARYHKQEYVINLKLKISLLENEIKKLEEELNLKEKQRKLF